MSKIGKILLAFAATALAMTAFASAAMAGEGVIVDAASGDEIPANHDLHFVGWAEFADAGGNGFKCGVTAEIETTQQGGSNGDVTVFEIPDTEHCEGTGVFAGCELAAHNSTNIPWHVTTTKEDFDISGEIEIHNTFDAACLVTSATLSFTEVTATPLVTGSEVNTNTENTLGETAKPGDPIAGAELSGTGSAHLETILGTMNVNVAVSGKLELTGSDRDTWTIAK